MSYYVKINDEATPFLKRVANQLPNEFDRALKSTGWWLRGEIREGIAQGAPGGQPYKPFSGLPTKLARETSHYRRAVKAGRDTSRIRRFQKIKRGDRRPLGRLGPAVRYRYYQDSRRVVIGWISPSAEKLGTLHEKGGQVAITPKMRRMFFAAGIGLSAGKTHIYIPRRPTIGPEYIENAPKIPGYIENKIWNYLEKA